MFRVPWPTNWEVASCSVNALSSQSLDTVTLVQRKKAQSFPPLSPQGPRTGRSSLRLRRQSLPAVQFRAQKSVQSASSLARLSLEAF